MLGPHFEPLPFPLSCLPISNYFVCTEFFKSKAEYMAESNLSDLKKNIFRINTFFMNFTISHVELDVVLRVAHSYEIASVGYDCCFTC